MVVFGSRRDVLNGASLSCAREGGVHSHWRERILILINRITGFQLSVLVILAPVPTGKEAAQLSICAIGGRTRTKSFWPQLTLHNLENFAQLGEFSIWSFPQGGLRPLWSQ